MCLTCKVVWSRIQKAGWRTAWIRCSWTHSGRHPPIQLETPIFGWTYLKAASLLACSLTGDAENCPNKVSCTEGFYNYALLMQLLEDRFCPKDQTDHFHSEFRERDQHPNKNATAFGHVFKQLGPWAFPTFPVVGVKKAIIEQFVDCLLDDQMHCHL